MSNLLILLKANAILCKTIFAMFSKNQLQENMTLARYLILAWNMFDKKSIKLLSLSRPFVLRSLSCWQ